MCSGSGNNNNTTAKEECEMKVDTFLNDHCKSIATTTDQQCANTTVTMDPTQCSATDKTTVLYTQIVTVNLTCTQSSSTASFDQTTTTLTRPLSSKMALNNGISTTNIALAALLALSVVVLAVVTTGWVCTCLVTKKRAR